MNKLLISLLSLSGVVGISTGGYFLLKGNEKNSEQKVTDGQKPGESPQAGVGSGGTEQIPSSQQGTNQK